MGKRSRETEREEERQAAEKHRQYLASVEHLKRLQQE